MHLESLHIVKQTQKQNLATLSENWYIYTLKIYMFGYTGCMGNSLYPQKERKIMGTERATAMPVR